jgi:WD40 repeat protein
VRKAVEDRHPIDMPPKKKEAYTGPKRPRGRPRKVPKPEEVPKPPADEPPADEPPVEEKTQQGAVNVPNAAPEAVVPDDPRSIRLYALDLSKHASAPTPALTLTTEFAVNAGRKGASSSGTHDWIPHDNHLKGARWSPDGVCLLTCGAEDNTFRVYDIPNNIDDVPSSAGDPIGPTGLPADRLWPALRIKERESVYDYAWYPGMNANDPGACVFASTSRATPVHLWDAVTGSVRASYVAHDHLDEPTAALSVAFSSDGTKLLAGYKNCVRSWDLSRPGRTCDVYRTLEKKRGRGEYGVDGRSGQVGLVSCIATSPATGGLFACGSYGEPGVGVYHEATGEQALVLRGGHGRGGVTHLTWSPCGTYLYTGARRDGEILCWDVRNPDAGCLYRMRRASDKTNQRIGFDVEFSGRHLVTGGTDGCLRAYDLRDGEEVGAWRASGDTVSDWSFHPGSSFVSSGSALKHPRGASASGHRHFRSPADGNASDGAGDADTVEGPTNALQIWSFSVAEVSAGE